MLDEITEIVALFFSDCGCIFHSFDDYYEPAAESTDFRSPQ